MKSSNKGSDVDHYIKSAPIAVQEYLKLLRKWIHAAVPEAEEVISYGMPTYKYLGILVHFAGWQNHVGFYPSPSAIEAFRGELEHFETSKGTIKFPLDQPLPQKLINDIIAFRMEENIQKEAGRKQKKHDKS